MSECMESADEAAERFEAPAPEALRGQIEALLMMATEPMPLEALADATRASDDAVAQALEELTEFYDETGRGFQLVNIAGGWRYATRSEHDEVIKTWIVEGQQNKLTQASLETLAVVAYMQPVSRSRVSAVRGVNVDGVVRTLIARGLVVQEGNDEQTGASMLSTTDYFLERLGLASLTDLPPIAPLLPDANLLEQELAGLVEQNPEAAMKENSEGEE